MIITYDTYDNYLIMGDFNTERSDFFLKTFLNSNNLYKLVKSNTWFKGKDTCIDLFLTNRKYSFKFSGWYKTGISDHHDMIYTMPKSCFSNTKPKLLNYIGFKFFSEEASKKILAKLSVILVTHKMIMITFSKLHKHATKKKVN